MFTNHCVDATSVSPSSRNRQLGRSVSIVGLAALTALACADIDAPESGESLEEANQDLVVYQSMPPVAGGPTSYARVIDRLTIDLDRQYFNGNGSVGKGDVKPNALVSLNGTIVTQLAFTKNIGDHATVYYPSDLVWDFERTGCFDLTFVTLSLGLWGGWMEHKSTYCWDPQRKTWWDTTQNVGIGTSQSAYVKVNKHFDGRFYWRVQWEATVVSGQVDPKPAERNDGPEWHHLPPIPWAPYQNLTATMTPFAGNPDLYGSTSQQPGAQTYNCRPAYGAGQEETCLFSNQTKGFFSARNASTDSYSSYDLVIDRGIGGWTAWFDRDDPTGNGDGEHLSALIAEGAAICAKPLAAQCRRKSDGLTWQLTGEVYSCTPDAGGICLNANQSNGYCADYEVRFYCP